MIINLNKHGPRCDLLLGNIRNRGSTLASPVLTSHTMVVKPPGIAGRSRKTLHLNVTDALRFMPYNLRHREEIAPGYPAESQPGIPVTTPLQTQLPHSIHQGESEEIFCNGRVLIRKVVSSE